MPPKSVRRPPQADIDALIHFVEGEFEKADRGVKPDPGRVTARRLNRNEYSNTVQDLLGVTFRGHPDMRRILLPDDWVGHPLLKDYHDDSVIPRPDYI